MLKKLFSDIWLFTFETDRAKEREALFGMASGGSEGVLEQLEGDLGGSEGVLEQSGLGLGGV
eukprot:12419359-Karenia_brevis.AAC.1